MAFKFSSGPSFPSGNFKASHDFGAPGKINDFDALVEELTDLYQNGVISFSTFVSRLQDEAGYTSQSAHQHASAFTVNTAFTGATD